MSTLSLTIGPLALFALVASITPGPNNLLLMRSGALFGVRRSLWHLAGVQAGFAGLVVLAHLGAAALLLALLNAWLFHHTVYRRIADWDRDAVPPRHARLAGGLSLAFWVVIITAGRMMAYQDYWFN